MDLQPELNFINRFHNTIGLEGSDLKAHQFRAGSQNTRILELFRSNPDRGLTAWAIVRLLGWQDRQKVSAGRSLTDLTTLNYLYKTDILIVETCGEKNFQYKLKIIQ